LMNSKAAPLLHNPQDRKYTVGSKVMKKPFQNNIMYGE